MIAIIAVLCSLSSPANCHEQTVTISDFANVSMQSCLMGAPQLADWMKSASDVPDQRPLKPFLHGQEPEQKSRRLFDLRRRQ